MSEVMAVIVMVSTAVTALWIAAERGRRLLADELRGAVAASAAAQTAAAVETRARLEAQRASEQMRADLEAERTARIDAEARAAAAAEALRANEQGLDEARTTMQDTFAALSGQALRENGETFLRLAREALASTLEKGRAEIDKGHDAIDEAVKPLREALDLALEEVRGIERAREKAFGSIEQQVKTLAERSSELQREASSISSALRTPHARGRWGELTLRRAVEAAGMSPYCDFEVQPHLGNTEARQRPDLVVRLPGARSIAVDAKVPLTAFADAAQASDDAARAAALARHAASVRDHVRALGSKAYWSQFAPAPELVVLFLPAESLFAAAVDADKTLLEDAVAAGVMIATPTTLIALLLAIAFGWQQQQSIENSAKIAATARELFDRVCKFGEHLVRMQDALRRATVASNAAAASFDARVIPAGRRLAELGVVPANVEIAEIEPIDLPERELALPIAVVAEDA